MSNDYVQIADAAAAQASAAKISTAGELVSELGTACTSAIEGIESGAPWGHDKYGEAFLAGYGQTSDGQGSPNQAAKAELSTLGPEAVQMGSAVISALDDYAATDQANAKDINAAR